MSGGGTRAERGFSWVLCGLTLPALLAAYSIRPGQVCQSLCLSSLWLLKHNFDLATPL